MAFLQYPAPDKQDSSPCGIYVVVPEWLKKAMIKNALAKGVKLDQYIIDNLKRDAERDYRG